MHSNYPIAISLIFVAVYALSLAGKFKYSLKNIKEKSVLCNIGSILVTKFITIIALFIIIFISVTSLANAYEYKISAKDKIISKNAFVKIRNNQYEKAINEASSADNKVITKITKWLGYQDGYAAGGSMEIARFIDKNPQWPSMKILKNKLELSITGKEPAADIIRYFNAYPPVTGHGMRVLAEAKIATGGSMNESASLLRQSWQQGDFGIDEEEAFFKTHGKLFTEEDNY